MAGWILRALGQMTGAPIPLRATGDGALLVTDAGGGGNAPPPTEVFAFDNRSGDIAVGGTSQLAAPADTTRMLLIQNPADETEPLYYQFNAAAEIAGTSPELAPGQAALFDRVVPSTEIFVNAATTGHRFIILRGID
jgi:hypothetical protein